MFLALEIFFASMVMLGFLTLTIGARRYNISNRTMAITFAITALSWMGMLITTIAFVVFIAQVA